MRVHEILSWLEKQVPRTAHLCLDSRCITRGDVFFACPGSTTDGRDFIDQAIANGAGAVVVQNGPGFEPTTLSAATVPVLRADGLSGMLGELAHLWYDKPSEAVSVLAVTGTNGKTTTVQWLAAALNAEGVPCGTIGTLGLVFPDGANCGGALTTPDVLAMHRSLAALRDAGAVVVALEASSIGIRQGRLDHVHIAIAGFTNLTRDHLDFHGTFSNYKAAKFALFQQPGLPAAVINGDDPSSPELLDSISQFEPLVYSMKSGGTAGICASDVHGGAYGLIFNLSTPKGTAQIVTRLIAEHNVSNLLLVAGMLHKLGWPLKRIARVLARLAPVPGRLQIIEGHECADDTVGAPMVVVDYAHTPDALERALAALRVAATQREGRLICIFGCGGSRDRGKRPIMGRIAAELADRVILTSDNPRSEDPRSIVDEIASGMPGRPEIELDRARAILTAIWRAGPSDVILVAGKGHETYQECNGVRSTFDDREWARFALTWQRGLSVSTDSRTIRPGELFVALQGDKFDGHQYLEQVRLAGACAAIVAASSPAIALHQFVLGDTRAALIRIADAWRQSFTIPVIGVTGSNGKTTTKEMIASILRAWAGTHALATQGNLNNDIGVPLTVMRLAPHHKAAVFELGMNHPGEISLLANVARPTVGLVNNAQREHQEFMHTVEAVARENGAVISSLPDDGVAVFPGDDRFTGLWREMAGNRRIILFGFEPAFDVHADQIQAEPTRTLCQLHTPTGASALTLGVPGVHNLRNALAATACACALGIPVTDVVRGLESFNPVAGRLQSHPLANGMQLIDDSYNANPDSVRAAIDVLAQLVGKKILVLGDMAEVGADSKALHAEAGAYARERAIDVLLAFGPAAAHAAAAFGAQASAFDSIDALVAHLAKLAPANILVKGSRSTRMERVVHMFEKQIKSQDEGSRHAS